MSNPIVTIEMENGGVIRAELYPEVAPNTVRNFVSLVQKGFYDGTIFHRVIPGMDIVDAIVNTKRDWHDRPREEQKMKSVTVDTQGVEYEAPETL